MVYLPIRGRNWTCVISFWIFCYPEVALGVCFCRCVLIETTSVVLIVEEALQSLDLEPIEFTYIRVHKNTHLVHLAPWIDDSAI